MLRGRCCYCILCSLITFVAAWIFLFATPQAAFSQTKQTVSFIQDVAPIFKKNCFACHDAKTRKGKLDLTTYATFRKGGTKDDPIEVGQPKFSILMLMLTDKGPNRMPPKEFNALKKEELEIIAKWIKEGAKLDKGIDPKDDLIRELRVRWTPPAPPEKYSRGVLINAITFTPDGKQVAVGGYHEVTFWDVASGKLQKRLFTRSERAHEMVFLPDGKLVIAGGRPGQEGNVRIYNLKGNSKMLGGVTVLDGVKDKSVFLKELVDTDDTIYAVAVSSDGKRMAAGGCDRTIRVWDLDNDVNKIKLNQTIENHADWILGLAFSEDGKHLATASRDKTAKVWNLEKKESLLTFPSHQEYVYDVTLLPKRKLGVSVGGDRNARFFTNDPKSKNNGKQTRAMGGHGGQIFELAFHNDAKLPLLATCSEDKTVRLWNAANYQALRTLTGHNDWVFCVALSPDGKLVASGAADGQVRIWNTTDGKLVKEFNASPGYTPATTASKK